MPPRVVGLLLLACSAGTTALHRAIGAGVVEGLSPVIELAFGLSTFFLASAGILLLIHGGRLLDRPDRIRRSSGLTRPRDPAEWWIVPIGLVGRTFDTRRGASLMQARYRSEQIRVGKLRERAQSGRSPEVDGSDVPIVS